MDRKECEEKIFQKLAEIRDIVDQFDPEINQVNMAVFKDNGWAFTCDQKEDLDVEWRRANT